MSNQTDNTTALEAIERVMKAVQNHPTLSEERKDKLMRDLAQHSTDTLRQRSA